MKAKYKRLFLVFFGCLILGMLIAFVQAYFIGARDADQRVEETEMVIGQIGTALSQYKIDCGSFPNESEWMESLLEKRTCSAWKGPYLKSTAKDSWGQAFIYHFSPDHAEVISLGADHLLGGEGKNADIQVQVQ